MQRILNRLPLVAGVVVAWLSSNASAAPGSDLTAYANAGHELQQLMAQATRDADMPQLTNPKAAELIAVMSDLRSLTSRTYQLKDMGGLMDLCDQSNKVVMTYLMFNVKSIANAQSDPQQLAARLGPLMEKNLRTFQNELERLQPFLFRCVATEIPLLTQFAQSLKPEEFTDIRRTGLKDARNGTFQIYYGALRASGDPAYTVSYRTTILHAIADLTPQYASVLQPQARKQLAELAASTVTKAPPPLRKDLQVIVTGMSDPRCEGLCAL